MVGVATAASAAVLPVPMAAADDEFDFELHQYEFDPWECSHEFFRGMDYGRERRERQA